MWNNGPEDNYFCGLAWDENDCARRQNCRSGLDTECDGHTSHGVLCFSETTCDTKCGGAAAWSPGRYDLMVPSAAPVGEIGTS